MDGGDTGVEGEAKGRRRVRERSRSMCRGTILDIVGIGDGGRRARRPTQTGASWRRPRCSAPGVDGIPVRPPSPSGTSGAPTPRRQGSLALADRKMKRLNNLFHSSKRAADPRIFLCCSECRQVARSVVASLNARRAAIPAAKSAGAPRMHDMSAGFRFGQSSCMEAWPRHRSAVMHRGSPGWSLEWPIPVLPHSWWPKSGGPVYLGHGCV